MNPTKTNCSGCGREVELQPGQTNCPQCGNEIATGTPRRKINWLVFLAVLLAPVALTILSVLLISNKADLAPGVALIAGGVCGIICGAMLGCSLGKTVAMKWVLGIVFALIFAVVCIVMSCVGCMVGGYSINFH